MPTAAGRSPDGHPVGQHRPAEYVEVGRGRLPAAGEVFAQVQPDACWPAGPATDEHVGSTVAVAVRDRHPGAASGNRQRLAGVW